MRRQITLVGMMLFVASVFIPFVFGVDVDTEHTGYLSDSLCGNAGFPEGYKGVIDLTKNPENHIAMCLKMDNCTKAGYGIFMKQKDGKYKYYAFDTKGSDLVKKNILDKITDKMTKNILISVKGTVIDATITITSAELVKPKNEKSKSDKTDKTDKAGSGMMM